MMHEFQFHIKGKLRVLTFIICTLTNSSTAMEMIEKAMTISKFCTHTTKEGSGIE